MLVAARATKEKLSSHDHAELACPLAEGELAVRVARERFEAIVQPLVDRTIAAIGRVLRDAKASKSEVQGVVLVGGSTRVPMVQDRGGTLFRPDPLTNLNPDEVVALGAAIQANALAGNAGADELLLLDVIPLSLGLETMGGLVERIIRATARSRPHGPRTSRPLPTARPRCRSMCCRASASWSPTAVRSAASSCEAFRRWSPARRASASASRSMPTAC
jgi:molecular chaperone DnaK (HSP70)